MYLLKRFRITEALPLSCETLQTISEVGFVRRGPWMGAFLASFVLAYPLCLGVAWMHVWLGGDEKSLSVGGVADGRIEGAQVIPPWGEGYTTYSILGAALGRQYVDGRVRDALIEAFALRAREELGREFVVGETGWPRGGRFRPHRTHRNGRSVDLFVPLQRQGQTFPSLGIWPWNKFGYSLEFDEQGRLGELSIDFEALAALLLEIDRQAASRELRIDKIIIAPEYVPFLLQTEAGRQLGPLADVITRKPVWVRHDEHIHIDFGTR